MADDLIADIQSEEKLLLATKLENVRSELTAAKTVIRSLQKDIGRLEVVHDFLKAPITSEVAWAKAPKRRTKQEHGTVVLMLSDLHLDEVVDASEMMGRNAYNREIADLRLKRIFQGLIEQAKFYHQGTIYDGAVVVLGGDLVNGDIHDELRETNEYPIAETIRYWVPKIVAGLQLVADEFGKVHVPSVPGNHGRFTAKPRYKKRSQTNADWLMSMLIASTLAGDPRFTFDIPNSMDTTFKVYDTNVYLTHGDQAGGGSGIGGIFPPIMKLKARKQANFVFDWMMIGHFHQHVHAQGITVNNSIKGWDEYALGHSFPYDEPGQAMFIITPEHGVTWPIEIFCQNRKTEGW